MILQQHSKSGALNLLQNCMNIQPHNKVLLVCEDPKYGWYDDAASMLLSDTLRDIGAKVSSTHVGCPDDDLPIDYDALVNDHDTIIYLARIGDQDRFHDNLPGKNVAMLYARDAAALSSSYASFHHSAMKELKAAIDKVTLAAKQVTITCPLGTQVRCNVKVEDHQPDQEVSIKRFPLCVPQPVLAKGMTGQVALTGWLTPTGSRSYTPASCQLEGVVFADVENGRILGYRGEPNCVEAIKTHYKTVSEKFNIDKDVIHSWHAGIHPGCSYAGKIANDPDRWSNNIFGSPRYLHFHTCGNYPPGEICWMVLDPTICIDGVSLWENGRLSIENFKETSTVADNWPVLRSMIDAPDAFVGITA